MQPIQLYYTNVQPDSRVYKQNSTYGLFGSAGEAPKEGDFGSCRVRSEPVDSLSGREALRFLPSARLAHSGRYPPMTPCAMRKGQRKKQERKRSAGEATARGCFEMCGEKFAPLSKQEQPTVHALAKRRLRTSGVCSTRCPEGDEIGTEPRIRLSRAVVGDILSSSMRSCTALTSIATACMRPSWIRWRPGNDSSVETTPTHGRQSEFQTETRHSTYLPFYSLG